MRKEFAAKEKLEIVLFASASRRDGQKGGLGGIPPADLPAEVSTQAGPSQFRSDIFKQTPPIGSGAVNKPSIQNMAKIAKMLGVSIEELI